MASRRKKRAQARNANFDSATQSGPGKPRLRAPSRIRQLNSTSAGISANKAEPYHRTPPNTTRTLVSGLSVPKTTSTPQRLDQKSCSQAHLAPKEKRQSKMAGRRNNARAAPNAQRAQAQLELPEGYVPPKKANKSNRNNQRRRQSRSNDAGDSDKSAVMSPEPATKSRARKLFSLAEDELPWVLDPRFPEPKVKYCAFNYQRSRWHSLGKNPRDMIEKYLRVGYRARLPPLFPDMNHDQIKKCHAEDYWKEGEYSLFRAKYHLRNVPNRSRLLLASSVVPADDEISPVNDETSLIQVLQVSELGKLIIDKLNPSIGDITALAATCKRAAALVRQNHTFWDFQTAKFPTGEFAEVRDNAGRLVQGGGVRSNILVISPISDEPERPNKPYADKFKSMMELCASIVEIPVSFRSIVLDQIPFLSVEIFEMMVNTMPNLKAVTITRCPLLNVTALGPLLKVIRRHPRPNERDNRGQAKRQLRDCQAAEGSAEDRHEQPGRPKPDDFIQLDFFPVFFRGPNSRKRVGSYGVTYHEPTFDTPKAVFCLILRHWDLAKEVGMDLVSESSSFWSFVRQLPGPDVLWALKAREALLTREYEQRAQTNRSAQEIEHDFADDLTAALTGDNQKHAETPSHMERRLPKKQQLECAYWRNSPECGLCKYPYLRSLFPLRPDTCWGCKMDLFISRLDDSHMRFWQLSVASHWAGALGPSMATIRDLLEYRAKTLDDAVRDVQTMDRIWNYYMSLPEEPAPEPSPPNTSDKHPNSAAEEAESPGKQPAPSGSGNEWTSTGDFDDWGTGASVDWDEPTTEPAYMPPVPACLGDFPAALSRWRWYRHPVRTAFDYRQGGPQHEDPCKIPLDIVGYDKDTVGPESKESFDARWEWSTRTDAIVGTEILTNLHPQRCERPSGANPQEGQVSERQTVHGHLNSRRKSSGQRKLQQNREWQAQNREDKQIYREHHARVEGYLWSLVSLDKKPYNLDRPLPDPYKDEARYRALLMRKVFNSSPYGFTSAISTAR